MSLQNPEIQFASATVSLLDRTSQTVEKVLAYPVTRVELNELVGDSVVARRVFVVDDSGHWVEAS